MKLVIHLWRLLDSRQRRWAVVAQAIALLTAVSTAIGIAAILPFFTLIDGSAALDGVPVLARLRSMLDLTDRDAFIFALGLLFIGAVTLANAINIVGAFLTRRIALGIGNDLQALLFAEYLRRDYAFHSQTDAATLFKKVVHEAGRVNYDIVQSVFALATGLLTALFLMVSVVVLSPIAGLSVVAALAIAYAVVYLVTRRRLLRMGEQQVSLAALQAKSVIESLGAIREILMTRSELYFRERFESVNRTLARSVSAKHAFAQSPRYLIECVAVVGLVGVALIFRREGSGGMVVGQLGFIGFTAYRLLPALQQVYSSVVQIRVDAAAFFAIEGDLRVARARGGLLERLETYTDASDPPNIELHDVNFRYPGQAADALIGLSMSIPARSITGFVGPNGSGKTTALDLIAGLMRPTTGFVVFDGERLTEADPKDSRRRIAYVSQHLFLLDTTLIENVAFGVPRSKIDIPRAQRALALAQLDSFVASLPNGYEEVIGDRGVRLSGGIRQRLALARAFYREATVLLLDEVTSSLDADTEVELVRTLGELAKSTTIILTTHRPAPLAICDRVFEFRAGRAIARAEASLATARAALRKHSGER